MERITEITPAFDKRTNDPKTNYGIHGCDLRMILKGELGAVQFVIFTGWHLPHVQKELNDSKLREMFPMAADLGYHSPTPHYDGHPPIDDKCPWLDDKPCYYDGSGLNAQRVMDILISKGSDKVWEELEDYYIDVFGELK